MNEIKLQGSLEKLSQILYKGIGGYAITQAVSEQTRKKILAELQQWTFKESKEHYGKALQKLSYCNITNIPDWQTYCPVLSEFKQAYDELYQLMGEQAGFTGTTNELRANRYEVGPIGITPHKDELRYKNLIGVLVVEGAAEFAICENREGGNPHIFEGNPRDLLLMRAPRKKGEGKLRPIHYIKNITKRRCSLGMRYEEVNNDRQNNN